MKSLCRVLVLGLMVALLPQLAFADAAGTAKGVNPAADARRSAVMRTLVVGSDIFLGDKVETGDKGQVQILFADQTRLVVGPRSALVIEDYLIRNDGSAGHLAVNMMSGAFRFVTGRSGKDRYDLDTPSGTIGIRGTAFDVFVAKDETRILLYRGSVRFCNLHNICGDLSKLCSVGEMSSAGATNLGVTSGIAGAARDLLRRQFIYAENQAPLQGAFRIGPAYGCLHAAAQTAPAITNTRPGGRKPTRPTQPGRPQNDKVAP